MRSILMKLTLSSTMMLLALGASACNKDDATAPSTSAAADAASGTQVAPAAAGTQDKPTTPPTQVAAGTEDKGSTESAPGTAQPAASGGMSDTTKATLAKAYVAIYCAQRRGHTEKLLEIYARHGFQDPETWTKTWTEAAKDGAWVAQITQDAIRECN